jgi:hypothetical protein
MSRLSLESSLSMLDAVLAHPLDFFVNIVSTFGVRGYGPLGTGGMP